MSFTKRVAAGLVVLLVAAAGCAIVLGIPRRSATAAAATSAPATIDAASAFAIFRAPEPSSSLPGEQAQLRAEVLSADDASLPLGQADFSLARPVEVPGDGARGWVVPSGERVCTIIVRPASWGAGCATAEQIDDGEGLTVLTQHEGRAIVVDFVADGATGPTVVNEQGARSELTARTNVAVAVLPVGDQVQLPAGLIALAP